MDPSVQLRRPCVLFTCGPTQGAERAGHTSRSGSGAQSRCFHPDLPSRLARLEPCPWPQALSNAAAEGTVYSAFIPQEGPEEAELPLEPRPRPLRAERQRGRGLIGYPPPPARDVRRLALQNLPSLPGGGGSAAWPWGRGQPQTQAEQVHESPVWRSDARGGGSGSALGGRTHPPSASSPPERSCALTSRTPHAQKNRRGHQGATRPGRLEGLGRMLPQPSP